MRKNFLKYSLKSKDGEIIDSTGTQVLKFIVKMVGDLMWSRGKFYGIFFK